MRAHSVSYRLIITAIGELRKIWEIRPTSNPGNQGAQIMLLNNDSAGRWINRTVARVEGFVTDGESQELIAAELETGEPVSGAPYRWKTYVRKIG